MYPGRTEERVPGTLLDPKGVVPADGAPRNARRPEIVKRHRLPRRVALDEQLGARDAGEAQAATELPRELPIHGASRRDKPLPSRLFAHRMQ
jgi:hypothetical protein